MLKHFAQTQIRFWDCICNFHGDSPCASSSSFYLLYPCSFSVSPSFYNVLSPSFPCSSFHLPFHTHPLSQSVFFSFLSQPITLFFLPWRQYYQCSACSKLYPESFLELEIGVLRGWRYSCGEGRACFTHQSALVSRDCSSSSPPLPPAYLHVRHAVAPVLSLLQHTLIANRKLLEGRREQNHQLSMTAPPYEYKYEDAVHMKCELTFLQS